MAEQLNLFDAIPDKPAQAQYVSWLMESWTYGQVELAIRRYRERTKSEPGLIAYRKSDKSKLLPILSNSFKLGQWETDAVQPGYIWICDIEMINFWETRDRSYSQRNA